jgi:hypothetical protein
MKLGSLSCLDAKVTAISCIPGVIPHLVGQPSVPQVHHLTCNRRHVPHPQQQCIPGCNQVANTSLLLPPFPTSASVSVTNTPAQASRCPNRSNTRTTGTGTYLTTSPTSSLLPPHPPRTAIAGLSCSGPFWETLEAPSRRTSDTSGRMDRQQAGTSMPRVPFRVVARTVLILAGYTRPRMPRVPLDHPRWVPRPTVSFLNSSVAVVQ